MKNEQDSEKFQEFLNSTAPPPPKGMLLRRQHSVKEGRYYHSINWAQALMHLVKGTIGTGILALPSAFKDTGTIAGPISMVLLCALALLDLNVLVKTNRRICEKDDANSLDYGDLTEATCRHSNISILTKKSEWGMHMTNFMLVLFQLGVCSVYVLFTASTFRDIYVSEFSPDSLLTDREFVLIFCIPFVIISLVKNLDRLAIFSVIANITVMIGLAIVIWHICTDIPNPERLPESSSFWSTCLFFGKALFAVESIGVILPVENKMHSPHHFKYVLNGGYVAMFFLYVIFGFLGFNKYGLNTMASISLNLPTGWMFMFAKFCFGVTIYFSYSVQLYVALSIILPPIHRHFEMFSYMRREIFSRVTLAFVCVAVAAIFPKLDFCISLVGAFAGGSLALLIPPLLHILMIFGEKDYSIFMKCLVITYDTILTLSGLFCVVLGTYVPINDFIKSEFSDGAISANVTLVN